MVGTPQRRFVAEHVSERALISNRATLAVTTFDLMTGEEVVHQGPGDPLPVVDAVMAAVATPGLVAPRRAGDRLLAEATLIESVPIADPHHRSPDRVSACSPASRSRTRGHRCSTGPGDRCPPAARGQSRA